MDQIEIETAKVAEGTIRPPGSKSITNRALVCAALADGTSQLTGALDSDDTRVMIDSLQRLGFQVETDDDRTKIKINGLAGGIPTDKAELFIGNSGTTVRFLTAMLAVGDGEFTLDGVPRMRERPIKDLLSSLKQLGVETVSSTGCPPVTVHAKGLHAGEVRLRGDVSSQYLSGLLMVSPCAKSQNGSTTSIQIDGPLVSKPYVSMTMEVMRSFGAICENDNFQQFTIPADQTYSAATYEIEPDASAASYFWAAAAITKGNVTVLGLTKNALQGDVAFCECLAQMGCDVHYQENGVQVIGNTLRGIDVDMNHISDTVQTLSAVAIFADGPTRIRGVAHNRHKETDRIGDLATELRKFGATVNEFEDGLEIIPGELRSATIDTYDDHRMAMSLSLPGLRIPGVRINDPDCTSKTYPEFFKDLAAICKR